MFKDSSAISTIAHRVLLAPLVSNSLKRLILSHVNCLSQHGRGPEVTVTL